MFFNLFSSNFSSPPFPSSKSPTSFSSSLSSSPSSSPPSWLSFPNSSSFSFPMFPSSSTDCFSFLINSSNNLWSFDSFISGILLSSVIELSINPSVKILFIFSSNFSLVSNSLINLSFNIWIYFSFSLPKLLLLFSLILFNEFIIFLFPLFPF